MGEPNNNDTYRILNFNCLTKWTEAYLWKEYINRRFNDFLDQRTIDGSKHSLRVGCHLYAYSLASNSTANY